MFKHSIIKRVRGIILIHISKVKETIQYLFTETWKYRRLFFLLYLLDILLKAIQPFINVVFPKVIIEQFIGEKNLEKIIFFTALMVLLNVLQNILERHIMTRCKGFLKQNLLLKIWL